MSSQTTKAAFHFSTLDDFGDHERKYDSVRQRKYYMGFSQIVKSSVCFERNKIKKNKRKKIFIVTIYFGLQEIRGKRKERFMQDTNTH